MSSLHKELSIAAIGETLWDLLPSGPTFGGAPANFSINACSLGASVCLLSAVGNDELGSKALKRLASRGIDCSFINVNGYATGQVDVKLDPAGNASYQFQEECAWDHIHYDESEYQSFSQFDAICFGTLAQRSSVSRSTIKKVLDSCSPHCLKIFDVNLRQDYYTSERIHDSLHSCDIVKLNQEELDLIARMFDLLPYNAIDQIDKLAERFQLRGIVVTKGENGALISVDGKKAILDAIPTMVVDTIGAGDSFAAASVIGLLRGLSIETIIHAASHIASYVCSQQGATPELPAELIAMLR